MITYQKILAVGTDRSEQTVQTQIRLLPWTALFYGTMAAGNIDPVLFLNSVSL